MCKILAIKHKKCWCSRHIKRWWETRFIHDIPFSAVSIVMVKLFSKCILGAEMHGLCQILGNFLHPTLNIFLCFHTITILLALLWSNVFLVSAFTICYRCIVCRIFTGFCFLFIVNNLYMLNLFLLPPV